MGTNGSGYQESLNKKNFCDFPLEDSAVETLGVMRNMSFNGKIFTL
jgi:hypothetical protein